MSAKTKQTVNRKVVKKEKSVDFLLELLRGLSYYYDRGILYVTIRYAERNKSVPVASEEFMTYVIAKVYNETYEFITEMDIKNCLRLVKCDLNEQQCCEELFASRYVFQDGKIYIDMCDDKHRYVEISEDGYRIRKCENETPLFAVNSMGLPLVRPKDDNGSELLSELDSLLNLTSSDKFLFKVWLVASMLPTLNVPILYLLGKSGSGKSSVQKVISGLVDPNDRGLDNWDDLSLNDIAIALDHSYVVHFDNVSKITTAKSDILCQSVTGGKTTIRKKYTDADEITFNLRTRVTISSIESCIQRDDLATRILFLNVPPLTGKRRIGEDEFDRLFKAMQPMLLGQIYDIISTVLSCYNDWKKEHYSYHRMNEFEVLGSLIAHILDGEDGEERFRTIMEEKYVQQFFRTDNEFVFMNCMFRALEDTYDNDYSGGTKRLYDGVCEWINESPDCEYEDVEIIAYDKFAKMLRHHEDVFPALRYEISFGRLSKENLSSVAIRKMDEDRA